MNSNNSIILVLSLAGMVSGLPTGIAQTSFQTYRCADGTNFIVGFYPYDLRLYMQIDGRAVTLSKRFALSGRQYSGGGVTFSITRGGVTTVRHAKRPETTCERTP
jgi:membrane-bound inhibitor of C-type lysozyme